jgi:hypothetical protein
MSSSFLIIFNKYFCTDINSSDGIIYLLFLNIKLFWYGCCRQIQIFYIFKNWNFLFDGLHQIIVFKNWIFLVTVWYNFSLFLKIEFFWLTVKHRRRKKESGIPSALLIFICCLITYHNEHDDNCSSTDTHKSDI